MQFYCLRIFFSISFRLRPSQNIIKSSLSAVCLSVLLSQSVLEAKGELKREGKLNQHVMTISIFLSLFFLFEHIHTHPL